MQETVRQRDSALTALYQRIVPRFWRAEPWQHALG